MQPPPLDRSIGMEVYATSYEGIGGRLRVEPQDFLVEEILDEVVYKHITHSPTKQNPFTLCILTKKGLDTIHAASVIEQAIGARVRYLGLKDANAITNQYITIPASAERREIKVSDKILVRRLGYLPYPLNSSHLIGNRFKVTVRDVVKAENLHKIMEDLAKRGVPNYFGYQRFGSKRPVSHLIGRALVKRRFDEAVELLLSYSTEEEHIEVQQMRRILRENPINVDEDDLPPVMDLERRVLKSLKKHPKDYVKAVKALPLRVRRLLVNAYQSYLFNRALSEAVEDEVDLSSVEPSDLYVEFSGLKMGEIKRAQDKVSSSGSRRLLLLFPLVGYGFREERFGRLGRYASKTLEEEELTPRSFYIDDIPELSVEGGLRPASMVIGMLNTELKEGTLTIEATLARGCYVTSLLREIMKPQDPVKAGF